MAVVQRSYCSETWRINREINHCDGVTVVCVTSKDAQPIRFLSLNDLFYEIHFAMKL